MSKFTAIYTDHWTAGSNHYTAVRMMQVEQQPGETVVGMLEREGIAGTVQFLFVGHPKMQGQE